jgi:hypothetical protein
MKKHDHEWALGELNKLNPDHKFDAMLKTVAIITKLLEAEQLKPIIVGGFLLKSIPMRLILHVILTL